MKKISEWLQKYHKDRLIWCLITLCFCWNDIGDYHHMTANKQLVVWMLIGIFCWYKRGIFSKLKRWPIALATIVGLGSAVLFIAGNVFAEYYYYNYTVGALAVLWMPLWVDAIWRMIREKKIDTNPASLFLLLMCAVMQISPNTEKGSYLLMLFVLVPFCAHGFDRTERKDMLLGIMDGICVGFLVTQAYAFGFRHYQETDSRYRSYRDYCTFAGMSYLMFYIGWMMKYLVYAGNGAKRWKKNICWWMGAFTVALMYLTGGRSPVIGVAAVTLVVMAVRYLKEWSLKHVGKWILGCAAIGVTSLLLFPAAYCSVRYLPTIIGHPDYLDSQSNRLYSFATKVLDQKFLHDGEYTTESLRVGDPYDAVQYITFAESVADSLTRIIPGEKYWVPDGVYEKAFEAKRVRYNYYVEKGWYADLMRDYWLDHYYYKYFGTYYEEEASSDSARTPIKTLLYASTGPIKLSQQNIDQVSPIGGTEIVVVADMSSLPGETAENPWFPAGGAYSSMDVRNAIHLYSLQHLNWTGHERLSFKMYLTEAAIIGHSHNIFLNIGYDYGIGAMLCMIAFFATIFIMTWKEWNRDKNVICLLPTLLTIGMIVFGIWEAGFRWDYSFAALIYISAAGLGGSKRSEIIGE